MSSTHSDVTTLLQAGIAAAKSGQRDQAHDLLMQVVQLDEENVPGWLWLCGVMDDPEDRETCLENVLALDPDNQPARRGLARLQHLKAANIPQAQPPHSTETELELPPILDEPPAEFPPLDVPAAGPAPAEPVQAARASGPRYKRLTPTVSPQDISTEQIPERPEDPLEDEFACPFCLAKTQPNDSRCRKCGKSLWLRRPRRKKSSTLFKILLGLQVFNTLQYLAVIALLMVATMGLAAAADELDPVAMAALPLTIAVTIPIGIYNVAMLVGLYKRWRPIFYLYLLNSILALGAAAAIFFLLGTGAIFCGAPLALLGIIQFFLILNLGEDFTFDKYRILLRADRDLRTGLNFLDRGHSYARRNMWGMAAFHFRRATLLLTDDLDSYLALTVACINMKRYGLAAKYVVEAKRISPTSPKVGQLESMLETHGF